MKIPIDDPVELSISKINSTIESMKTVKPKNQKNFQYLILVAKTNGKKNAIQEKPGK